jgi:ribosome maturation factor RimP
VAESKIQIEQRIKEIGEPIVAAEGLELLEVEYVREREGWILRLFIDRPGGAAPGQGIGLDECTAVSRAVETALDVEDIVPQEYSLEVSSPGLNRPLTKPEHFKREVGKLVKVKTFGPLMGVDPPRKHFTGILKEAGGEAVTVEVEGAGSFIIPLKDIAKANLEFEF